MSTLTAASARVRGRRMSVGVVDQVASSLSNFMMVFAFARAADPAQFGAVMLVGGINSGLLTVGRLAVGTLLALDLPDAKSDYFRRRLPVIFGFSLCMGAVASIADFCCAIAVHAEGADAVFAICVLAASCPILMLQDVGRMVAVSSGRPIGALLSDSLWVAVMAVWMGASWLYRTDVAETALAWLAGLLIASLSLALSGAIYKPQFRGVFGWAVNEHRLPSLLGDGALRAITPVVVLALAGAFVGVSAIGSLRGASTLFAPINVVIISVNLAVLPEARRAERRAVRLIAFSAAGIAIASALWACIVIFMPLSILRDVLGASAIGIRHIVPYSAAEVVGLACATGSTTILRLRGHLNALVVTRIIYSAVAVAGTTMLAAIYRRSDIVAATLALCAWLLFIMTAKAASLPRAAVDLEE